MYDLIPPLVLIFSLAGLIILFVKKFSQAEDSSGEKSASPQAFGEKELRVFGFQKKILLVVEKVLGVFVFSAMRTASSSSRLLGKVKVRSREVQKASDFAKHYFDKIKSKKARAKLTKEEEECIELIKTDPSNTDAYKRLGDIYLSRGNYEDAKLSFEQVLRLNPDGGEAKARLDEIEERLNEGEGGPA